MKLLELQRTMARAVMQPLTLTERMQRVAPDGRPMRAYAARFIKPNDRLTSFERLEIYNRQYWFRVIEAISGDFPALNAVLGPKRFDALILAYLKENPSMSWTLRDLGARLPAYLEAHPELGGRSQRLAVDVANLEWAYVDAFDGRQLAPLTWEELQAIEPDSRLSLQPHLQLLAVNYPVDELVLAVRRETPKSEIVSSAASERASQGGMYLPSMKPSRLYLAVHRFEESVYYRPIEREEFLLLNALREGLSIAGALGEAFEKSKLTLELQATAVQQCFAHASELGWLCPRLEHEEDPTNLVM
jgi:hypothetical protein